MCPVLCDYNSMNKFTYTLSASEDNALVDLIAFVEDMGLPEGIDHAAYESLTNKILDNIQQAVVRDHQQSGVAAPVVIKNR